MTAEPLASGLVFAGLVVALVALVALHLLPTGLSPLNQAVSQYGITSYRLGYRVQTLGYAVAGFAAAYGLGRWLPSNAGIVVLLCVAFGGARAAISWFPMDVPGSTRTSTGRRHGALAMIAFVAITLAAFRLANALRRGGIDRRTADVSAALGVAMVVVLLAMTATRRSAGGRGFGLAERVFYLAVAVWLVLVAVVIGT